MIMKTPVLLPEGYVVTQKHVIQQLKEVQVYRVSSMQNRIQSKCQRNPVFCV